MRVEDGWTTRQHGDVPRTDTASRVVAASSDRVYAALIDPDALAAWLPPAGMSGRFEQFDARPGGSYRMVLTYADASTATGKATADSDIVEARFIDIVPGRTSGAGRQLRQQRSRPCGHHDDDLGGHRNRQRDARGRPRRTGPLWYLRGGSRSRAHVLTR
jgi:hypothetical protein